MMTRTWNAARKFTAVTVEPLVPQWKGGPYLWRVWVLYPGAGSSPDGFVAMSGTARWAWRARLAAHRARREREA